jgi:RNA polymerase sigma-70 factor (ECF subfamily)
VDWKSVFAEHDGWLRKVVATRVGEPQAVCEVLQEVALAASKQASLPSEPHGLSAWLYRVAIRATLIHRRKAGRRRRMMDRLSQQPQPDGEPEPLDWLLADERRGLVRKALARLGDQDREILLLKYSENWTAAEIAHRLGLRLPAVEARLHRARSRLRAALGEW